MQESVFKEERINGFCDEDYKLLSLECFNKIINNQEKLSKKQIVDIVTNIRDLFDRY